MTRPDLHVVFTMDCPPAGGRTREARHAGGPASWELSARVVDAFCTVLLRAGFPPTLFLTPEAAAEHGPMCEDLASTGVELGLLVQPPALHGAGYRSYLGAYSRDVQRAIVSETRRRFVLAVGQPPVSARSAMYSASDDTFAVLSETAFRQASVSSPGRRLPRFGAVWTGAAPDAHFASAGNRLVAGTLPLLEVPVTTDASQNRGGVSPDLCIENGTVELWHRPLVDGQLERQEAAGTPFRTLCFATSSKVAYHDPASRPRRTLEAIVALLHSLEERYSVVPVTLAGASAYFGSARLAGDPSDSTAVA